MPNYLYACPRCNSTSRDIGDFASYFEVFECARCDHRYCYKCRDSNGGRVCPECGSDDGRVVGRVAKS